MNNSKKILEMISGFIEAGILTSQDLRKELSTSLKFQSENLINRLDLVKKKEFQILKKIVQKQQIEINKLKKNKTKKAKKS
jgi:BMFP domain-containing protein YqiC|tara:strand:+ start:277 stop:519 length:243 start_codon:yes stop_codon:yes gene_type:complete